MKAIEQMRQEARKRQIQYESMTVQERIAKLDKGGFAAKKERARLQKK